MCGIAGMIGSVCNDAASERMMRGIAHRGPDDRGVMTSGGARMLHTRLAILDLSCAGHQPMTDHPRDGTPPNVLVFNGEIYNFRQLHADLATAGWRCETQSDSEVLLNAYRVWGDRFLERLRGMWAFCLVDRSRGIAHLARDRFGIKPLYMHRSPGGALSFASEVRALLALGPAHVAPIINPAAVEGFLAQGAVPGEDSIVRDVQLLPPAVLLTVDLETGRELRRRTYWELPRTSEPSTDRKAAIEHLGATAREAVRLHLISDVPVGLFLSGGIDSAALLALASEQRPDGVRTVNVGFDVPEFDESAAAASIAARFGARHSAIKLTGAHVLGDLPAAFAAMDQPTIDGINVFAVSRATRDAGLTVALSGLGSDELFGGYSSFHELPRAERLRRLMPLRVGAPFLERIAPNRAGAKAAQMLRRPGDLLNLYLLRRELFFPEERRDLHDLPHSTDAITGLSESVLAQAAAAASQHDSIGKISMWELTLYMRHMLLRDGDAFSMAAPIEYRVPFLDHVLAEEIFRLPSAWKRRDPRPKPLLIDLVGDGVLPESVWKSPKRGFSFPWGRWLSRGGPLEHLAIDSARHTSLWKKLGMRPAGPARLVERYHAGDKRVAPTQILALIVLGDFAERHGLRTA